MMPDTDNKLQIFTYDKETEKKTGALTMMIFSICLLLFPLIIAVIDLIGVSLGTHFLSEVISIASGAVIEQIDIVVFSVYLLIGLALPLVCGYVTAAIRQILCCYVRLEDGRFMKLKWQLKAVSSAGVSMAAREISEHLPSSDRRTIGRTIGTLAALAEAIELIQNREIIGDYIAGNSTITNITCFPLSRMTVLKKTKKKLVIMADTLVKNQPKRKKFTIYWMYQDMDSICQICEGGNSHVNN